MSVVQVVLLAAVALIQLVCAVGVLAVDDPFDRLHLVGPVSVLGSILLVAAVVVGGSSSTHIAKVAVIGAFLWGTSPFLTRATASALRIRSTGRLDVGPDELGEDDQP